jgi:hypothetical protein
MFQKRCLELELWGKDARFGGSVSPVFYTRSGEMTPVPAEFQDPVSNADIPDNIPLR